MSTFETELRDLINRHSQESNTPDFILAQRASNCLLAFNRARPTYDVMRMLYKKLVAGETPLASEAPCKT